MIFLIQKFCHYLLDNKFVFRVHHNAVKHMINKPQLNGCITRWVLLLKEFKFRVEIPVDKNHANVDHPSRLNEEFGTKVIDDSFPDAQISYINLILKE